MNARVRNLAASWRAVVFACAAVVLSSVSCYLDTRGLTGRRADAGTGNVDATVASIDAGAEDGATDGARVASCVGIDAAVCEDFDGPTSLEGWRPPQLANGGQLTVDSTASVSPPNALWSRTPAQGPVPRSARVLKPVTLGRDGFAVEMDVLVEAGCTGALAIVTDDFSGPYYQFELVAGRGQLFSLNENDNDNVTPHAGTRSVQQGWTHLRCEVRFASPSVECFVDEQRALGPTPVTPARPLAGRAVHVGIGVNYDSTSTGCSARIDNYVFRTW